MLSQPLRFSHLAYPVTALGPGRRVAIWVAGCSLRCQGCITPELQLQDSGQLIDSERLLQRLLRFPADDIQGLSLTGGEPFEQAAALGAILQVLRSQRPHWDYLAFSGYPLNHLRKQTDSQRLLAQLDLLIAGPYQPQRPGQHPLQASENQTLHALTERGEQLLSASAQAGNSRTNLGLGQQQDWLIGIIETQPRQAAHATLQLKTNPMA